MNLVEINNNLIITSSITVAENFEKEHRDILRNISNLKDLLSSAQFCALFKECTYKANNGKTNPMYLMNRDGFSLLAMGFTGAKALEWKIKYIEAFNDMEQILTKQLTAQLDEKQKALKRKLVWNRNARRDTDQLYQDAEARYAALLTKYNELKKNHDYTVERLDYWRSEGSRSIVKDEYIKNILLNKQALTIDEWNTIENFINENMNIKKN